MKKKYYLTLDTETATLPFANEICKTAKEKQKVAIAKPLVYDLGWTITDRQGNILDSKNYLIAEIFSVPTVFNTAYYKDKKKIYIDLLKSKQIKLVSWNDAIVDLLEDLRKVDLVTAFNACFDFKKAIPFTEKYIENLYSSNYYKWEAEQKKKCLDLLEGKDNSKNEDYLKPYFELRGESFPVADLWGVACERLINIDKYRDYCLKNNLLTDSKIYFKTNAETSFQYLMNKHDFTEDHTALSDALIEAGILTKALKKGKVEPKIEAFPFRQVGLTYKYVQEKRPKYKNVVEDGLKEYLKINDGIQKALNGSPYWSRILNIYEEL